MLKVTRCGLYWPPCRWSRDSALRRAGGMVLPRVLQVPPVAIPPFCEWRGAERGRVAGEHVVDRDPRGPRCAMPCDATTQWASHVDTVYDQRGPALPCTARSENHTTLACRGLFSVDAARCNRIVSPRYFSVRGRRSPPRPAPQTSRRQSAVDHPFCCELHAGIWRRVAGRGGAG